MVDQSIVEGLKFALNKGQSLREAMMSFYNSGYPKQDIEEAARALHTQTDTIPSEHQVRHEPPKTPQVPPPKTVPISPPPKPKSPFIPLTKPKTIPEGSQPPTTSFKPVNKDPFENLPSLDRKARPSSSPIKKIQKPIPATVQKVSSYGEQKPAPRKNLTTVLLVILLFCLVGGLIAIFFFKEELIIFLETLLG